MIEYDNGRHVLDPDYINYVEVFLESYEPDWVETAAEALKKGLTPKDSLALYYLGDNQNPHKSVLPVELEELREMPMDHIIEELESNWATRAYAMWALLKEQDKYGI